MCVHTHSRLSSQSVIRICVFFMLPFFFRWRFSCVCVWLFDCYYMCIIVRSCSLTHTLVRFLVFMSLCLIYTCIENRPQTKHKTDENYEHTFMRVWLVDSVNSNQKHRSVTNKHATRTHPCIRIHTHINNFDCYFCCHFCHLYLSSVIPWVSHFFPTILFLLLLLLMVLLLPFHLDSRIGMIKT